MTQRKARTRTRMTAAQRAALDKLFAPPTQEEWERLRPFVDAAIAELVDEARRAQAARTSATA